MTIQSKLESLKEEKYREFSLSLLPKDTNVLGVRLPILRKLSKETKLEELTDDTFEEKMLQAMIIGNFKNIEDTKEKLITFLPKIDNWSICDSLVSSLHITIKHPDEILDFLKKISISTLEYTKRFVLVMLLRYYINEEYINKAITLANAIKKEEYYTKMAYSWFITEIYAYDKELAKKLLVKQKDQEIIKMTNYKIKSSFKIKKKEG